MHRIADDLVGVVLGFLPGEKGSGAGEGRSRQVARRTREAFPHNDCKLGSGTRCSQPVVCDALVVARVLQRQLVDKQDSRALGLHSAEWLDGLPVLQPVQHWGGFPRAVAHKPGSVPPGERHRLRGLKNYRRGWWKQSENDCL